uniref:Nose resistant-to-fluoxetine protein N-terminal domain-containing protein n=2 Tax=Parascaris univalens TaxID=6257 RepID=A0A915BP85_PARUN
FQCLVVLVLSGTPICHSCLLCPLRLPPRPRPIDHFQLPSPDRMTTPESASELCEAAKRLHVSDKCREGVTKIFCSLADLIDAKSSDCTTTEDKQRCVECSYRSAKIVSENLWVITWLDSLGKMPSAISEGNHHWLGDYEQCMGLKKSGLFDGRYCLMQLEVPDSDLEEGCLQTDPMAIDFGICAPEHCSEDEVNLILRSASPYNLTTRCELSHEWPLPSQIFMSMIVVWITVLIGGTVVEVSEKNNLRSPDTLSFLGRCVSMRLNGYEALRTKREHAYHSVQGLQVILVAFIITANCYSYMMPYIENVLFSYDMVHSWLMQPLNNFSMHTDALIAINALFTSLLLRKSLVTTFDVKKLYVKRLLQVLPAFAFLVIFMTLIFERLSSGPMWNHGELIDRCESSWWKNILFISNLFSVEETCVDGGYLLALEAQFFIVLIPLLHLSNRYKSPLIAIAVGGLCASIAYVFYLVYSDSLPPSLILTTEPIPNESMRLYLDTIYTKPWSRAPAFLIGFLSSFLFKKPNKLDEIIAVAIWLLLFASGVFILFALFPYSTQKSSSPFFAAFYAALHRPAWCLIVCVIIYLCYRKNGREFGAFLEWRLFTPLARVTYLVFIISEPVSLFFFSSLHRPLYATHWSTLYIALGTIVLSYIFALTLDVFISRPIRNLLIFGLEPYLQENRSYEKACSDDVIEE